MSRSIVCADVPVIGKPYHPANTRNYLIAFARPWVNLFSPDVQARGAHLIIAKAPRIPEESVDPTVKNFHWGDLTRGLFEAHDAGADGAVLVDRAGFVTEGPGYNIFSVTAGEVSTPDRGALEGVTRPLRHRALRGTQHSLPDTADPDQGASPGRRDL